MSSRSAFRRKVVLPITIIRRSGQDKLLAHTLDLTETSARVGGLAALLEPGEIVEVQRGAVKAKFQVFWMGAPSSAMAGQAGIRSMEPGKAIWGVILPDDTPDLTLDASRLRSSLAPVRSSGQFPGENRWHPRYQCNGSASVRQTGVSYPIHAEIKDISRGGIYLEMSTPLLVGAQITVTVSVQEVSFEAAGTVRTSYPLVGMGIAFTSLSPKNQETIAHMIASQATKRIAGPRSILTWASRPLGLEVQPLHALHGLQGLAGLLRGRRRGAFGGERWPAGA